VFLFFLFFLFFFLFFYFLSFSFPLSFFFLKGIKKGKKKKVFKREARKPKEKIKRGGFVKEVFFAQILLNEAEILTTRKTPTLSSWNSS
jgi:predicted membrane protein